MTGDLSVVKATLNRVKSDYLWAMHDLELANEENATLEKEVDQLYEDLQNLQLDFEMQEEVMHFKMQKENFLSTDVDWLTNELSTIDVEPAAEQAALSRISEHTTWNFRRFNLEQVRDGLANLDEKITEGRNLKLKAFHRMNAERSEEDLEDSDPKSDNNDL
ncbi:hypothetical protein RND71_042386 [Anisodus tanguticus]|uniref:Uncharacterized protein n=1 Tax=Anisodus tanguticus TaxID=243964 RepID=A0AAE1UUR8_9SOLA|nr:hypothetical protein RND71_042386 [Anisodus tanguticus]